MLRNFCLFFFLFNFSTVVKADFDALFNHLPFSQQDKQKVLQGKLVTSEVKESNERELAVMLAFLIKRTPTEVKNDFINGTMINLPESILSNIKLTATSTITDLSKLRFSSKESDEIEQFLSAQPGNKLNLSADEIKQFQSLKSTDKQADKLQTLVVEQLHKVLLNRFKAYSEKGAKAISPYQREHGELYSLGQYFQKISKSASLLQQYYPKFYQTLNSYPVNKPEKLEESFFALKLKVQGRPTFSLMHRMLLEEGDAFAVAIRQYYATQSFNGEQNLGLFVPVKQGVLVLGVFRTSSDEVAGFGSGAKHAIGRRLLASSLTEFYEEVQRLTKNK